MNIEDIDEYHTINHIHSQRTNPRVNVISIFLAKTSTMRNQRTLRNLQFKDAFFCEKLCLSPAQESAKLAQSVHALTSAFKFHEHHWQRLLSLSLILISDFFPSHILYVN